MSEVMKCDVCGTFYEKEYENIFIEEKRTNGANLNKYDLCPACIERFHQWLDSSANEKEVVSADNDPTVEEIDQEHDYIRWEEQDAIIVEWTELKIPFSIEFVDPGEKL